MSPALPVSGALPDPGAVPRPWVASYPPGVPATYPYPDVPLTRLLDDAARDFPTTAVVAAGRLVLTYRELLDRVDRVAAALGGLGVGRGDRVGLVLPTSPQYLVALFATLRLGAVAVPLDPQDTAEAPDGVEDLARRLATTGCSVVLATAAAWGTVEPLRPGLEAVRHWVVTDPEPRRLRARLRGRHRLPAGDGVVRLRDLVRGGVAATVQAPVDPAADAAVILATRGTTGEPKEVVLSHRNLVVNAFQARLWVPDVQAGRETLLCALPLTHAYGLTAGVGFGVLSGATLTLLPDTTPARVLRAAAKHRATLVVGAPAVFAGLPDAPEAGRHDLATVRACLSGGAPLAPTTVQAVEELTGGRVRQGYGLTEAGPITHANPVYGKAKPGAVGLPVADTVAAVVDPADPARAQPPGREGELLVAGPQVMCGYWERPVETARVLVDGWLRTGDRAVMDDDGYFTVVPRAAVP